MMRVELKAPSALLIAATCFVTAASFVPPMHAQGTGTAIVVKLSDAVESGVDPVGKEYHGTVTQFVDAGDGVKITAGSAATMYLVNTGTATGWAMQLVSVTVNGQPAAVKTGPARLTNAAQSAAGNAMKSVGSMLGSFGRPVRTPPAAATAIATGQRVVLPPGTSLTFTLTAPPTPAAAQPAPAAAPPVANFTSSAPAPAAAPAHAPTTTTAAATPYAFPAYYTLCRYQGQQDGHFVVYVTPIIHTNSGASDISTAFNEYFAAHYDTMKILQGSGYCRTVSSSADQQAYTLSQLEKQWADSKTVVTHLTWTGTPEEIAEANAQAAAHAPPPIVPVTQTPGGPWISCATSEDGGINKYLTGVFQTKKPVKHWPNGGNTVDQSVMDDFYAYLKSKGYTFKPGTNFGCDVSATEAAAKAAQHKRHYEGGGCSTCGKTVETGWTE